MVARGAGAPLHRGAFEPGGGIFRDARSPGSDDGPDRAAAAGHTDRHRDRSSRQRRAGASRPADPARRRRDDLLRDSEHRARRRRVRLRPGSVVAVAGSPRSSAAAGRAVEAVGPALPARPLVEPDRSDRDRHGRHRASTGGSTDRRHGGVAVGGAAGSDASGGSDGEIQPRAGCTAQLPGDPRGLFRTCGRRRQGFFAG